MKFRVPFFLFLALVLSLGAPARADITNGLVLYCTLDETTGATVHDSSGNGNDGTIQNFPGDSLWTTGWVTNGLSVNPGVNNEYALIPDSASLNFTNQHMFSLSCWVKMPTAQIAGAGIIAKGTGGGNEEYDLDVNASKFRMVVRNSAGNAVTQISSAANVPNNIWTHVAVVCDGTNSGNKTLTMYINGQLSASTTNANLASFRYSVGPVGLGARTGTASSGYTLYATNTFLDEVRLYNRVLTKSDAFELYSYGGHLPVISIPARSITNFVGDNAAFGVSIDANNSTLPLSYQWSWYGTNLPSATNAALTLTNVQFANSGPYSVAISNVIGITNSGPVYLQVKAMPAANITSGLAGYWKFDETSGSGTAADSSANGNTGALVNFADLTTCWGPGLTNGALTFNGDGSGLDLVALPAVGSPAPAALDFYASPAFTLSGWIKASSTQTNGGAIIAHGNGGGGEQYAMDINGGTYRFYVRNTNGVAFNLVTAIPPNGTWQHVAAVLDAVNGIMSYYVNGQLAGTTVAPLNVISNAHEVTIGNRQAGAGAYGLALTGSLDDVRIYNRALTSSDVQALYATGGLYPPSIATQPVGAALYVGDNYKLVSIVSGTFPIFTQWRTNGVALAGATNSTLILTNIQLANAATYTFFASNAYGMVTSTPAVITVSPFFVTNALNAWWKFDDATGSSASDSSTNSNTGALNNFPGDDSQWTNGRINGALSFSLPGFANSYVLANDAPSLNFAGTVRFSLSAWVKGPPVQTSGAAIVCKGTGSGGEQFCVDVANNVFRFFVRSAGNASAPSATSVISPNNLWQHIVATFDGNFGIMNLYVNGQLAATNLAPTSLLASTHEVTIGSREQSASSGYNFSFNGQIDDVRVFSRALTSNDVTSLYLNAGIIAPTFLTIPLSVSRYIGDNVQFSATADGTQPIFYQWQKDGSNIVGATTSTLVLTNLQATNAGNYSLLVTNLGGSSNSPAATLTLTTFSVNNPVAFWRFDESSGSTAADASGHGNAGTLNNFPSDNSEWISGRVNGALSFNQDGTLDDVVTVPDATNLNFTNTLTLSVAAWVRGPASQLSGAGIVAKGFGGSGEEFALDTHTDLAATPGYRFYVRNSAGVSTTLVSPVTLNGRWQHVVGIFDGVAGTLQIYVNGQLASSGPGPTTLFSNNHEVSIGNRQSGPTTGYNFPFVGAIDDVRIYDRALRSNEVQQIYAQAGVLAPVIYTQPQSTTNYVHDSVSFSVLADGTDPLGYQWKKNNVNVPNATNASFTIADAQFSDATGYKVLVTDANSSVLSSNAVLTILSIPAPDLTNELIAYWAFDETNGLAAADSSGRGNNSTLFNTFPGDDSQWVPGKIGGALHMNNGVTDNLVGTDNPVTLDNEDLFSFSFWAKRDPGAEGINPRFIVPNGTQSWVLWTPGRGVGFATPAVSTEPSSNTWHHFVVVYNRVAGTYSLYVDGSRQVGSASGYSRTDPAAAYWYIGHSEVSASHTDSFSGLIDDVRIYNRLLTLNDVQGLYFQGSQPSLTIAINGASITLSWPVGATGFHLYSATSVSSSWTLVPGSPSVSADGATQSMTITTGPGNKFYRLQKP